MLSVGIIGLPNVGKSTLFNALSEGHANVSNYPFTTIESNVGMVSVPDPRLTRLAEIVEPEAVTPCHVRFIDIAGLVEGASRGEGLGNQFLGEIRQVDAVAHVVRAFDSPDVAHVFTAVEPQRDAAVIETELLLADLDVLQRAFEKRKREWQTRPRENEKERQRLELYLKHLEAGLPLRSLALDAENRRELKALGLLTAKPVLWVVNVSESGYGKGQSVAARELAETYPGSAVVEVSAALEWELTQLEPAERSEFMDDLGLAETGLERLARAAFDLLGLIRFYTVVSGKLRAWEISRGTHAPHAAGKIHGDMEEGFIRARVAAYEEFVEYGDFHALQHHGQLRTEGKDYEIVDGDVVEFLFQP